MAVRTRYAPSPTGYAHLGFVSRVLINYALARKNGGQFVWRNEDTDTERFIPGALAYNLKWMREFGLDWDEGPDDEDLPVELRKGGPYAPYTQTKRAALGIYKEASDKLLETGYAYRCFCTKERLAEMRADQERNGLQTKYDGLCRNLSQEEVQAKLDSNTPFTLRIKMPRDRIIHFDDVITHSHITWNSNDVDDYIIVKSDGIPTYHLAAMYDDILMKISHVFRGSEWIATTPVHMMVYEGLGVAEADRPKIGHFTVILDPATPGKKMSKRNDSFRVNGLVKKGYLKEAILNYLMLLGWAPKDNREMFTLEEYVEAFDLSGMQKANPTWDQKKMDWFNGVYLRKLNDEEYTNEFLNWINKYLFEVEPDEKEEATPATTSELLELAKKIAAEKPANLTEQLKLVKERAVNFLQALEQIAFFYGAPKDIKWEEIKQLEKVDRETGMKVYAAIRDFMATLPEGATTWQHEVWEAGMRKIADDHGVKHGDAFMILRIAIVGSPFSPPLFEALQVLGKEEIMRRLTA